MIIDRSSRGLLATICGAALAACAALLIFVPSLWISVPVSILLLWFCAWQVYFFHVPDRKRSAAPSELTAVADGKVVICEKTFEEEVLRAECWQVSIYMNFFDVHANFWPADGVVKYYQYHPGKHMLAFKPKASLDNEHTCVILDVLGRPVLFKQIAGGFARRIVCNAVEGKDAVGGEQCGIIKFGSRIDYYLPLDAAVKVAVGEHVRACETVIAEI